MNYGVLALIRACPASIFCICLVIASLNSVAPAFANAKARKEIQRLPDIAKEAMCLYFTKNDKNRTTIKEFVSKLPVNKEFQNPAGVFVTLSRKGKTRACWGSIFPQHRNLVEETVYSTLSALTKDYRFKPVNENELSKLKIQVTVVRAVRPVTDTTSINPFRDGVMVRSSGKSGVILPGEASDAYYELVLAKLKAGIRDKEPFQLYKIEADIYD